MWELDHKEGWMLKYWCFWTVVLEKTLESPLDCKEIQLVHPKGNQPWIFSERTDPEAETPVFWPPDVKTWLTGKASMLGKTEGRRRRGWQRMRWLGGITYSNDMNLSNLWELVDGQGSLACCSPWGCKELDMTEWLNWTDACISMWIYLIPWICTLKMANAMHILQQQSKSNIESLWKLERIRQLPRDFGTWRTTQQWGSWVSLCLSQGT